MKEQPKNSRELGVLVELLRAVPHWSQHRLARESGIRQRLISEYELGKTIPKRRNLERIARAVGVRYETAMALRPLIRQLLAEAAGGGPARALEPPADLTAGLVAAVTAAAPRAEVQFALDLERLASRAGTAA